MSDQRSSAERVDHVLQSILASITPITQSEWLPILDASGRVLAQDVVAPENLPAAPVSAMDGYALSATLADVKQADSSALHLAVTGKSLAGRQLEGVADPVGAVRIFTGAVVPECYNCVVPQELVASTSSEKLVVIRREDIRKGLHVRDVGEDVRKGDILVARGQQLSSREVALLAQTGCARVLVHRQLKVSVVSIGDELRNVHQPLNTGLIHDSNRLMLLDLVHRAGAQAIDLGITPDDPASLRSALSQAASVSDLVISSGGVSVGEADHTRKVLDELGEIKFWRLAIKPGRPLAYGFIKKEDKSQAPFFGLPGNPVASYVTFLAIVRYALARRAGQDPLVTAPSIRARLLKATAKNVGRTEYLRCWLRPADDGGWNAEVMPSQGAANLLSLAQADGLVVLPHELGALEAGDWVDVINLRLA